MSRRILLLVAVGVVATVALSAGAASARPQQQVTLKFMAVVELRPAWDVLIANFQRVYPNIKVEAQYVPGTQFGSTLLTQLQADSGPDVTAVQSGAGSPWGVYALGSQGKLLDLTPNNPWWKRMPKSMRKFLTVKQRIYAYQTDVTPSGLDYNVDLFRSMGLTIPQTFSQLLSLCQKIAAAGKVPIALGMASINGQIGLSANLMSAFVYNKDPDWTLKRVQKKTTFASSPLWQRMLQAVTEMRNANCFPPAPAALTNNGQFAMIASGQAVMMLATSGEITNAKLLNPNLTMKQFAFPAENAKDTRAYLAGSQNGTVVLKSTAYPKEARQFIDFVARPKQTALKAKLQGTISTDDLRRGIVPDYASDQAALLKADKIVFSPHYGWPAPQKGMWQPNLITQMPGLFTGQRTPDQILQSMDALWDKPA